MRHLFSGPWSIPASGASQPYSYTSHQNVWALHCAGNHYNISVFSELPSICHIQNNFRIMISILFTFTTSQLNSIHDVPFHISSLALPCILGIHLSPSSWHNIQYWTFSVNKETLSSHSLVLGIISLIAKLRNLQDFNPRYAVNWLWDSCYCGPNIFLRKTRVKIAIVTNILHGQFVRV